MKITVMAGLAAAALSIWIASQSVQAQPAATPAPAATPNLGAKIEIDPAAMAIVE